ncbi:MAG: TetR/AcrR family transcriptional regulator [Caldilinea sp.]
MDNIARQQLVETTARLLEMQGYHGTGLNQIIRESGAPRGSLYYYFPAGKEELAAAAISEQGAAMQAHTAAILSEVAAAVEAVDRVLEGMVEHFGASHFCGGAPLAAVALETSACSERLRTSCAQAYGGLSVEFEQKLIAGGFAPERARRLATIIVASIEGAIILCRTQQSAEPLALVRQELRVLLTCDASPG